LGVKNLGRVNLAIAVNPFDESTCKVVERLVIETYKAEEPFFLDIKNNVGLGIMERLKL